MSMYLPKENEIQRIYSELGLVVPVGDLSTTKAPAIKPLSSSSTQTSITTQFNVMSGADITSLAYKVNDGASVSVTPQKGIVTITLSDLEYNSGPYEIELTATNETGSTSTSNTVDLQHYTNWATPDEVLLGNKYIGEDGEEHTGEYECPICPEPVLETVPVTPTTSAQTITPSTGYDGIGTVNVSAVTSSIDANITAGNIKSGVTILGVTGDYQGSSSTPQNSALLNLEFIESYGDGWAFPYIGYVVLYDVDGSIDVENSLFNTTAILNDGQTQITINYAPDMQSGIKRIGDAVVFPVVSGYGDYVVIDPDDPDTQYTLEWVDFGNIPCGQTNLQGEVTVYWKNPSDPSFDPAIHVNTATLFIPETQDCNEYPDDNNL